MATAEKGMVFGQTAASATSGFVMMAIGWPWLSSLFGITAGFQTFNVHLLLGAKTCIQCEEEFLPARGPWHPFPLCADDCCSWITAAFSIKSVETLMSQGSSVR
eukprot:733783-Pelagomonas_calceolata.AAC.5